MRQVHLARQVREGEGVGTTMIQPRMSMTCRGGGLSVLASAAFLPLGGEEGVGEELTPYQR